MIWFNFTFRAAIFEFFSWAWKLPKDWGSLTVSLHDQKFLNLIDFLICFVNCGSFQKCFLCLSLWEEVVHCRYILDVIFHSATKRFFKDLVQTFKALRSLGSFCQLSTLTLSIKAFFRFFFLETQNQTTLERRKTHAARTIKPELPINAKVQC